MDKFHKFLYPVGISYTNNKNNVVQIGKNNQALIGANTAKSVISGSKVPQPVIFFKFNHGTDYPMGYFRNRLARDMAFRTLQIIPPNKPSYHFDFKDWFKPVKLTQEQLLTNIGKVDFKSVIQHLLKAHKEGGFLDLLNSSFPPYMEDKHYTVHDVDTFRRGKVREDLSRTDLVVSLSLKFNAPEALRKKGVTNELFWGAFIFNLPAL